MLIQNPKLALLATALPLALRSRWRSLALGVGDSLPLGGSVQNPKLALSVAEVSKIPIYFRLPVTI